MATQTLWCRAAALALATATLLSLTACAPGAPSSSAATAAASSSPNKEAGFLTRDIHVCFQNASRTAVTLEWRSGISTNSGSGALEAGKSLCGEGRLPQARVIFSDSFATDILAGNRQLRQPKVYFKEVTGHVFTLCDLTCHDEMQFDTYTSASYAERETVVSDIEGHHFSVIRDGDDDWINFTVTILD